MLGDFLLYSSMGLGLISAFYIFRGKDPRPLVRAYAALLVLAFLLLVYYFVTTQLTIDYVWSYSSKDLPLFYKLSGVLGGQQGTLLFWAFLIAIGALWLNERQARGSFERMSQGVVILVGLYFIALTLIDSPFKTIYAANPDLDEGFVPLDGSGLNPLLLDPWMVVHPPLIFLGYASLTVPFAAALVYLYRSLKGSSANLHRAWVNLVVQWGRASWLFLTIGIAVGGFWSYKVLGWGGFWAWDPVETSSLIPWLLLTGTLHALNEHRKNRNKYDVLTPSLVGISFVLVLYATLVTRSGFFESIHAFGSGTVGTYLVVLLFICASAILVLAVLKYLRIEKREEREWQIRTVIFYLAVMLFIVLTFVSFWGVTFPALYKLFTGNKVSVGMSFFNLWSYPFFLSLMLLAGLGLSYRPSSGRLREFGIYAALTVALAFVKPSEAWNIVDYSAIVSPEKPLLYTLIGSASSLSFIPPSIYILNSSYRRARKSTPRGIGVALIHAGIVFIILGTVFSTLFVQEHSIRAKIDETQLVEGTPYSLKVIDVRQYMNFSKETLSIPSLSLDEFYSMYTPGRNESYVVRGVVKDVHKLGHVALLRLVDGKKDLWVATDSLGVYSGTEVVAKGYVLEGFSLPSLNMSVDRIMFGRVRYLRKPISYTQEAEVEVFSGDKRIAHGVARVVQYPRGDVKRVMIDRGLFRDVYIIFTGVDDKGVPLTLKIIPMVNYLWLGIFLFVVGITVIILYDPKYGVIKW
jgi:cytochrome c-type biogenesis protein CcmF